jgi:hypothetical protein
MAGTRSVSFPRNLGLIRKIPFSGDLSKDPILSAFIRLSKDISCENRRGRKSAISLWIPLKCFSQIPLKVFMRKFFTKKLSPSPEYFWMIGFLMTSIQSKKDNRGNLYLG